MGRIESLAESCLAGLRKESFGGHGEKIGSIKPVANKGFALLHLLARQSYFKDFLDVDGVSDYTQILEQNGRYWYPVKKYGSPSNIDLVLNMEGICHHSVFIFSMDFLEIENY